MDWADGDISKVNVDPKSRARLERKWGKGDGTDMVAAE
jgi:hypothetical protein